LNTELVKKILLNSKVPISKVLENFNETAIFTDKSGYALITNDDGKCVGIVSEGDIRRALLNKVQISDPVSKAMNINFVYVNEGDATHLILRQFDKNVSILPILDSNGIPIGLHLYSQFLASTRSVERIIRARVPVRMSFSGGGTDMSKLFNEYPSTVLSSTINKYCTTSIIIRNDKKIKIKSKDLGLEYTAKEFNEIEFGDDLDLIKAAIKIMQPEFGFNIETYAEFDPGTGLGGSSAVVVSVLGALNYFRNEKQFDIYQIADMAYQVERIDMGMTGGWQDQYATSFGGFSWIEFGKNNIVVNPLLIKRDILLELEYNLMLFKLKGSRNSDKIQNDYLKNNNSLHKTKAVKKMLIISEKMKKALLTGQVKKFADLLHESWLMKQDLNNKVTNDHIDECYNIARKLGALGGKLLGAGGTGYLLVYSSPLYQKNIIAALEKKEATHELFKFCSNGLEVWSTKR